MELPIPINPLLPVLAVHGRLFSAKAYGMQRQFPGAKLALVRVEVSQPYQSSAVGYFSVP